MSYNITDKQRIWLGIICAAGTFVGGASYMRGTVEEMLMHHDFHISSLLPELLIIAVLFLHLILFTVYIFSFPKKDVRHHLLSIGYILLGISGSIITFIESATYFSDNFISVAYKINLLIPFCSVLNLIENGDIVAFSSDLSDTAYLYIFLMSAVLAVFAVKAIRNDFEKIKKVRVLAIIVIILHCVFVFVSIPWDIELLAEGFYDAVIIPKSYSIASIAFLLFWVLLKPVSAEDIAPTFVLSDTAKAELYEAKQQLDLGQISQEDFQKKKAQILENM